MRRHAGARQFFFAPVGGPPAASADEVTEATGLRGFPAQKAAEQARVLPAGFYSTPITVTGDSALFPDSIAGGVTIFGVAGAAQDTSSGDATAGDLLAGSVAWADGAAITGTIPARGVGPTLLPTTTVQTLESGYWSTPITVTGDSDLVAGNLHAGATLFGVTGDGAVVDTSSGDATAADLLAGAVVWGGGLEITGGGAQRGVAPPLVSTTTGQRVGAGAWVRLFYTSDAAHERSSVRIGGGGDI